MDTDDMRMQAFVDVDVICFFNDRTHIDRGMSYLSTNMVDAKVSDSCQIYFHI